MNTSNDENVTEATGPDSGPYRQNGFHHHEQQQQPVTVSIEPNHESEIFELKYDGQEVYKE